MKVVRKKGNGRGKGRKFQLVVRLSLSLARSFLLSLSSSHRDKEEAESEGMNLVNCLLFSISMHSPCLSAPPFSFNYSPSFACFSFRLSRSTSSTSLHSTHTLSFSLFMRFPRGSFFFLVSNLLLTFRRVSMSRGGNTRMAAMGGESAH